MKMINNCLICNRDDSHIAVDAMVNQLMELLGAFHEGVKDKINSDPKLRKRALNTVDCIKGLVAGLRDVQASGWPKKCLHLPPSFLKDDLYHAVWCKEPEFVLDILLQTRNKGTDVS